MNKPLDFARSLTRGILCLALLAATARPSSGAAPEVSRVEPPNWWAGHSHNPVRLLITGRHLTGARLHVPDGFETSEPVASANGQYLLVNLHIPKQASPGPVLLRVQTAEGKTTAPFELNSPLPRAGRFQGFSPDDVIYLAMTDRFANGDPANDNSAVAPGMHDRRKSRYYHGGDFQGAMDRLNYLQELGVTALWLTPWYDNANQLNRQEKYTPDNKLSAHGSPITDYHGYGAVDFYGVEEHFGNLDQLRQLVDAAHARGIKVVQDQVANHTGPYHPWAANPPTPTWFNGSPAHHLANSWQIWTVAATHPPADQLKSTLEGWFIDILPDLNQNDPEVATYLIQNSLWWVGMTGLDAIRQDTLPYVPRTYWAQWTAALKREYPSLTILGELWDTDPKLVSFFQGGQARFDGVDSGVETLFDFPLYDAVRAVFAEGAPATRLAETLAADTNYVDASGLVPFLGLHDTTRFLNGSRASLESLQLAFTFLLTTRGTPLIYYGDEIALRGGGDPDNRRDFPGGWPEDQHNAFTQPGRTPEQAAMHAHVARLLALRRAHEPLRRGALLSLTAGRETYAFARTTDDDLAVVVLNNSRQLQNLTLPLAALNLGKNHGLTDRLGGLGTVKIAEGVLQITLPPQTAAILTPDLTRVALAPANEAK